jgi:hypothetical protein
VRKGRVGMRVRGNQTGREFTLVRVSDNGVWDAQVDGTSAICHRVVDDAFIGRNWLIIDAPADARAEAVQLRRRDLAVGDQFRYFDPDGPAHWEVTGADSEIVVADYRRGRPAKALPNLSVYNVIRAAAQVATPEVVRAVKVLRRDLCIGDQFRYERDSPTVVNAAIVDDEGSSIDLSILSDTVAASLPDSRVIVILSAADHHAAVSLRLAARAEERRIATQLTCQPQIWGDDDGVPLTADEIYDWNRSKR